jgi:hypothetical protein
MAHSLSTLLFTSYCPDGLRARARCRLWAFYQSSSGEEDNRARRLGGGFVEYLRPGIEARVGDVTDLSFIAAASIDFVFASNLFEHISQEQFSSVLLQLKRALTEQGTLNILQPNYYYAYREYFDDYTHKSIYSHRSICDFLETQGYRVVECKPRFLPLTVKSQLLVSPFLIRLYLSSPWKPLGKQMFIRAARH